MAECCWAIPSGAIVGRACRASSAVGMLTTGVARRNHHLVVVDALLLASFFAFASNFSFGPLEPDALLQLGMAAALVLISPHRTHERAQRVQGTSRHLSNPCDGQ